MLELVPEHDPSIEEKHNKTTYNSDDSHDDYLYLRLCMKNLSMIMIKNKQKTKQKLTPFERKKINVLQLLAKPKMFISSVDFFIYFFSDLCRK